MGHGLTPSDVGIDVGQVLEGKYRVDAILGRGGMGVVVECTHLGLNERYALKLLRQDVLNDQDAVQRFVREARAAVKLKSEYVAHVSDVGTFDNGTPFMVMEFLEGQDVGQLLEDRGVVAVPWATELMLQAAEALCEAHSLGIVHRDVKPSNLFVTWRPDGSALIKVLDFGISKSATGADMNLTQTQSVLGTPAYMSPEQMRSARMVDSRSDIWSLGTVLYEMIEGHRPFEAETFSEMCVKVTVDEPIAMVKAPPALQRVVMRCLEKSPDQRFPTMAELGRELVRFAPNPQQAQHLVERMTRMLRRSVLGFDGEVSASHPNISAQPRLTGEASVPASVSTMMDIAPPRRRWPWLLAGVLVVGAAASAVLAAMSSNAREPVPAAFFVNRVLAPAPTPTPTPTPVPPPPPVQVTQVPTAPVIEVKPKATKIPRKNPPATAVIVKTAPAAPLPEPPTNAATIAKPDCNPFNYPHGCPK